MKQFANPFGQRRSEQEGVTLVELMVALAIGLFMATVVGSIYIGSKGSFRYAEAVSRMQENARYALDLMARNIRMAGYSGCGDISQYANVVNGGNTLFFDLSNPVKGYEGGVSVFPTEFSNVVAGTDAVVLLGVDTSAELSVKNHNAVSAQIDTGNHTIPKGSILMITDCSHTAVFQMTGPTTSGVKTNVVHNTGVAGVSPGNCNKELGLSCPSAKAYTFKPGSSLLRLNAAGFYIAPSSSGTGNSLWMRAIDQSGGASTGTVIPLEMVEGVENMQIEYGLDTDANRSANQWVKANTVEAGGNWPNVVAVRVSLLMRTLEDNISAKAQTYNYNGASVTAADRRVRKSYTVTTTVRNRTP